MLVLTFRPCDAVWLWLAIHPPALMFVLTFICLPSDMTSVFAILYAGLSAGLDAALDLQTSRYGLVMVGFPILRTDDAGLDAALGLQIASHCLVVIIGPTACFYVRLNFHSYLLPLVID